MYKWRPGLSFKFREQKSRACSAYISPCVSQLLDRWCRHTSFYGTHVFADSQFRQPQTMLAMVPVPHVGKPRARQMDKVYSGILVGNATKLHY